MAWASGDTNYILQQISQGGYDAERNIYDYYQDQNYGMVQYDEETGDPVSFGEIKVTQSGELLTEIVADSMGYTRVRVPVYRDIDNEVIICSLN